MLNKDALVKVNMLNKRFGLEKTDGGYSFTFNIDDSNLEFITRCEAEGLSFLFIIDEATQPNISDFVGKRAKGMLTVDTTAGINWAVFSDWNDFIGLSRNLVKVPNCFLILEDETVYPSDMPAKKLAHYLDIQKIVQALIDNADHQEKYKVTGKKLVFLHKKRLDISIDYSANELAEALDGITIITSCLEDASHSEQKKSILKETLYSFLSNQPEATRMKYLLSHFGEFSQQFNENYQMFVSEFSFDEVREEYEEKKRDYLVKLNDVFSTIATKVLGVPIALALAAFKMTAAIGNATLWTNIFILLSVLAYVVIMLALVENQKYTLNAIKNEYSSHMNRLKGKYSDQFEKVKGIKEDLDKRHGFQMRFLKFLQCIFIALALIVGIFFYQVSGSNEEPPVAKVSQEMTNISDKSRS